jgi:undecaprenyl-diphosphatase
MPILHAIVLGITQGLSEFLPISSSGHLRLVPWLLEWNDFAGRESLEKTFDVALHLGTFIGAVAYFRADIVHYVRAGFRRGALQTQDGKLAWLLVLATIPASVTGAVLADTIEEHTNGIVLIASMLILFGLVLGWADRKLGTIELEEIGLRQALAMGVGQAIALQPGVSRSGVTMTAGRFFGLTRDAAARFAFLMSLPVTLGALVFKAADVFGGDGIPDGFMAPFVWGIVASGITGFVAVWGTLRMIRTTSFTPFVLYRVAAGALILAVYAIR